MRRETSAPQNKDEKYLQSLRDEVSGLESFLAEVDQTKKDHATTKADVDSLSQKKSSLQEEIEAIEISKKQHVEDNREKLNEMINTQSAFNKLTKEYEALEKSKMDLSAEKTQERAKLVATKKEVEKANEDLLHVREQIKKETEAKNKAKLQTEKAQAEHNSVIKTLRDKELDILQVISEKEKEVVKRQKALDDIDLEFKKTQAALITAQSDVEKAKLSAVKIVADAEAKALKIVAEANNKKAEAEAAQVEVDRKASLLDRQKTLLRQIKKKLEVDSGTVINVNI